MAKSEWDQYDEQDMDDPIMVAEYVKEIYCYMMELENNPKADYMERQDDLNWRMRGVLIDWLIDIHGKFRLVPETLFTAVNIIDRFLSIRTIALVKFQLVGLVALMIACKYEEIICPALSNFLYMAEDGYSEEEFLKAETFVLEFIGYDLSFPTPIGFLRRISKADDYDIKCRTFAKYFIEISTVDPAMVAVKPSLVAAASVWFSRKVLDRGPWDEFLTHLSTYTQEEILPVAQMMLEYIARQISHIKAGDNSKESKSKLKLNSTTAIGSASPFDLAEALTQVEHPNLHKKYQSRKFHKASDEAFVYVYKHLYRTTYRTDKNMPKFDEWKLVEGN
ncbi:hypothetical protein BT69DRAFT_972585 [Atractiella rhizophila]|nr:hypothetical protein BT69DRAFT_972585 [Atractiella rhizophila]